MEEVYKIIKANSDRTGNKSGISLVQIYQESGMILGILQGFLNKLVQDKRISFREGINETLFFTV